MQKMILAAAVAFSGFGSPLSVTAAPVKPYLAAALADPVRGDVKAVDARRHPEVLIGLAGAKPGDKIVDLIPAEGYFTKVFSRVVGPKGHVYMIWPNEYAKEARRYVDADKALEAGSVFKNVSVIQQPAAAFSAPEPVDVVFTSQNYHDYPDKFMGQVDPVSFDKAVFRALKPGGVFLVVAAAGSGLRDTDTLHRIEPAIVRKQVTSVGFKFVGQSNVC